MQKKTNIKTVKLTVIAMLTAISVVLRLLGFPQSGTFRVELGFLPIAITGAMFGPIWSGISYVLADLLGTLFTGQVPFPTITVCKLFFGIILGLFFYKKEASFIRTVICITIITLFIDFICMPFALMPLYGDKSFFVILTERFWATLFNYPLRIVTIYFSLKYLKPFITKEVEKHGHN